MNEQFPHAAINEVLRWIHSESQTPLYDGVWPKIDYDPQAGVDQIAWEKIPTIDKTDIQKVSFWNRLATPKHEAEHVRNTYGTTSKRVLAVPRKHYGSYDNLFAELPVTCLMSFFASGNYDSPRKQLQIRQLLGDSSKVDLSAKLILQAGVDAVYLTPYTAMKLAGYLKGTEAQQRIVAVMLCGEVCSAKQLARLHDLYPNAAIYSNYTSSEVREVTALTCVHDRRTENCLRVEAVPEVYIELVDEGGNVIDEEDQIGEVVITTLGRIPVPLIRYRTGDLAKYSKRSCACEEKTRGFFLYGRMDTAPIRIGRGEVSLEAVAEALKQIDCTEYEYFEVTIDEGEHQGLAIPRVAVKLYFTSDPEMPTTDVSTQFAEALQVFPNYTYAAGVRDNFYCPLTVTTAPSPHDPKSFKGPYSKMIRVNGS